MSDFTIAFDVGGTYIKSAVLDSSGQVCPGTTNVFPANAKASKDEILSYFVSIISQKTALLSVNARISGIGYAFPGPFDYENGICLIRGVDKYESIYNICLRDELLIRLKNHQALRSALSNDFDIVFENDAALFALGEWLSGRATRFERCIYLTIGTGAGSVFMQGGELIKSRHDVPANGWVYSEPFGDSIVDEYISRRGILRMASVYGLNSQWDVKELADQAMDGNVSAIRLFSQFGSCIGEMILPYVQSFQADGIVIGGQISKSSPLFDQALRHVLSTTEVSVQYSCDTSISTYAGVYQLLRQKRSKDRRNPNET